MQTFLPYPDFASSLRVLDKQRLGKQRVEAWQILRVLLQPDQVRGWKTHPAVIMWRGYENALKHYYNSCIDEWISRGCVNNMVRFEIEGTVELPWWVGNERFHRSHQSNLLRKNTDYYRPHFPRVRCNLPYWWPTETMGKFRTLIK